MLGFGGRGEQNATHIILVIIFLYELTALLLNKIEHKTRGLSERLWLQLICWNEVCMVREYLIYFYCICSVNKQLTVYYDRTAQKVSWIESLFIVLAMKLIKKTNLVAKTASCLTIDDRWCCFHPSIAGQAKPLPNIIGTGWAVADLGPQRPYQRWIRSDRIGEFVAVEPSYSIVDASVSSRPLPLTYRMWCT